MEFIFFIFYSFYCYEIPVMFPLPSAGRTLIPRSPVAHSLPATLRSRGARSLRDSPWLLPTLPTGVELVGQLFKLNYDWLRRVRARLGCPHDADDIAAETLPACWPCRIPAPCASPGRC